MADIKQGFFDQLSERLLRKVLSGQKKQIKALPLNKAKTALVIYPVDQDMKACTKIIPWLEQNKIKVIEAGYTLKKPEGKEKKLPPGARLHPKQFSLFRKPKAEVFNIVGNKKFDYIFDLFTESPVQIKHLIAQLHAGMKCGFYSEKHLHLDFMIQTEKGKNIILAIQALQVYVTKIKFE